MSEPGCLGVEEDAWTSCRLSCGLDTRQQKDDEKSNEVPHLAFRDKE